VSRAKTNSGKPKRAASQTERAQSVNDSQVLEVAELPSVRTLQVAVYEAATHATSAIAAIVGAGHVVAASGSGRDGVERVRGAIAAVDAVLVGLPGGEALIDAALALTPRRPVVIASLAGTAVDAVRKSAQAGADLVTLRPHEAERLAPVLLGAARLADERRDLSNARGIEAALRARLDAVADAEPGGLQPFELFQRILELEMRRARRYAYPIAVGLFSVELEDPSPPPGVRRILFARAANALLHSIRDIDLATELDHERLLVLLPYTPLAGATEVARRIIAGVGAVDPVIAGGRTFPAKVVAAVAGAAPGQPLSFQRLMRDASRALEQGRKDGAELAVAVAQQDGS
jgi:diguanylate cyclase with GGDEF domain